MKPFALLLALMLLLGACSNSDKVAFSEGPQEMDYSEEEEFELRDRLDGFPFKHEEWNHKFSEEIVRVSMGLEHLYLETASATLIAVDRQNGHTAWKHRVESDRPLEWSPVEASGVPQTIADLERQLRENHRAIEDAIKEEGGPGKKSQELQKDRRRLRQNLAVAQAADNIYFISRHILYCVDRRSGNMRWSKRLNFAPSAQPFAIRNYIFVASADLSRVWALDVAGKGDDITSFRSSISSDGKNHIMNQPVFANDTLYFVSHDSRIYAVDVTARRERWTYETERAIKADPLLHDFVEKGYGEDDGTGQPKARDKKYSTLFVGGMDNAFYAIDAQDGSFQWKYECGAPIQDRAIALGRTVYVKSMNGALFAFDINPLHKAANGIVTGPVRKGKLRWKLPRGERFLMKGRLHIYVLGPDNELYRMDELTGEMHGRYDLGPFRHVVSNTMDGMFYLIHPNGWVFALKESKREE